MVYTLMAPREAERGIRNYGPWCTYCPPNKIPVYTRLVDAAVKPEQATFPTLERSSPVQAAAQKKLDLSMGPFVKLVRSVQVAIPRRGCGT